MTDNRNKRPSSVLTEQKQFSSRASVLEALAPAVVRKSLVS